RRANQVGTVRVKAFFDQQVDLPEVDRTQVDGDFFGIAALWAGTVDEAEFGHGHSNGIRLPSKEHLHGWYVFVLRASSSGVNRQIEGRRGLNVRGALLPMPLGVDQRSTCVEGHPNTSLRSALEATAAPLRLLPGLP